MRGWEMPPEHRRSIISSLPRKRYPRRTDCGLYGCDVYGWPSIGGVIIRPTADAVELEYLGLDRLDPSIEILNDQDLEDKFCSLLLSIGGVWWPSIRRYEAINLPGIDPPEGPTEGEQRIYRYMGWPTTGGVWVSTYEAEPEGDAPILPGDIGRLKLCFAMEERCEMLKTHFGATFYPNANEISYLADLGELAIAINATTKPE